MNRRMMCMSGFAAAAVGVLLACRPGVLSPKAIERITNAAHELGYWELQRLQENEEQYRNAVVKWDQPFNVFNPLNAYYAKVMRRYTRYEISDIRLSDTPPPPVECDVIFYYDVLATKAFQFDFPNALADAEKETDFRTLRTGSITFTYKCDRTGTFTDERPFPPPQEGFFPPEAFQPATVPQL